ncbi:MAG: gephyrin-like molybdotransferase Glp [Glaciecola sp.]|jgi:molybdopterin molybdotransferase
MQSCDTTTDMLAYSDALANMLKVIQPTLKTEQRHLSTATNCVLSRDVICTSPVPAYDNAAMDGYALGTPDQQQPSQFTLVGQVLAGQTHPEALQQGQAVRIMTGAKVPDGTFAVVMQEHTTALPDAVIINTMPAPQANIRYCGEDIAIGETVLNQGQRLDAIKLGILASLGIAEISVYTPLKIALFTTGDELVSPGMPLRQGQIYDTNSFVLRAALEHFGCEVSQCIALPDQLSEIKHALHTASTVADVIITSGGVSVGTADFVKTALDNLGDMHFWKVAMKPGKPFAFGTIHDCLLFGLPGNPVSSTVTLQMLVLPALAKRQGLYMQPQQIATGTLTSPVKKRPGRMDFQRAKATPQSNGETHVEAFTAQGSALLSRLDAANVLLLLPRDSGDLGPGEQVNFIPIHPILQGQY